MKKLTFYGLLSLVTLWHCQALAAAIQQGINRTDARVKIFGEQLVEQAKTDTLSNENLQYFLTQFPNNKEFPELALDWAAAAGNDNALMLLMNSTINIHTAKDQPIRLAAANNHYRIVQLLLNYSLVHEDLWFSKALITTLYNDAMQKGSYALADIFQEYLYAINPVTMISR